MASSIDTSNINRNFPVQGQDNPSQGFRDNFNNIATLFDQAASEITDLQNSITGVTTATTSTLGSIIVGSNLSITSEGVLSATGAGFYSLPTATANVLGGVKIGSGVTVSGDGTISVPSNTYVLPVATDTILGGVRIGSGINVNANGVISVSTGNYTLPIASGSVLGGIKIGSGVAIAGDGTVSVSTATSGIVGGVRIGSGINITGNGTIFISTASDSVLGAVKIGSGLSVAGDGTVSVTGGGLGSSIAFANISVSGQTTVSANTVSDTVNLVAGAGITITTNPATKSVTVTNNTSPVQARSVASTSISNLAPGSTATAVITGFKGYVLYKVGVSTATWVRLYTSGAARTADASRDINTDPSPSSGVVAEVITTNSSTVVMSPGVFGFNDEAAPTTAIPITVTNLGATTATIAVTLTLIQLEA